MSKFRRKITLFGSFYVRTSSGISNLGFLRNPDFFPLRLFSCTSNEPSFMVSYLINELGWSSQAALSVSKYVNFESSEKPDKVINLFKKYGFTQTQISRLLRAKPQLLVADTQKSIRPKLEFFDAKGVSWPQFTKKLSQFPAILGRSLDKHIVPSYEFLRNFLQSNEKAIAAVEKYPDILIQDIEKCLKSNIDILGEHGVPNSKIAKLIPRQPYTFSLSSERFREVVEEVVEMGFDPKRTNFLQAVLVLLCLSKSTWACKVNAFKKWDWSEEEVLKAFQSNPWCMMVSEDKLMESMDFFTNQMGWKPCLMAKYPTIFNMSLKKRVVPRCFVSQFLLSKGLVEKEISISALLLVSEERFLQKFVVPYEKKAPEMLKLYKKKLDISNGPVVFKFSTFLCWLFEIQGWSFYMEFVFKLVE